MDQNVQFQGFHLQQLPAFVMTTARKGEDHFFPQKRYMLVSHFSKYSGRLLPAVYKNFNVLNEIYQTLDKRIILNNFD